MSPKLTGTFDASQMKLHLNKYVTEISDMLTSAQDIERYADFTQSVIKLNGLTGMFYQMNEDGTYPLLTEEDKKMLTDAYQDAMEQAAEIVNGNETGAVGEQMRSIAGVLLPMMHADHAALEITDVSRAPFTLPVLIGNARAQTVDMGDQQTEIESGMMSSRRHIKVQNGTTVEEGFFTASSHVNIEKRYFAHLDKMAAKYPDYKPLIDAFRAAKLEDVFSPLTDYTIYSGCKENDFDDDLRSAVLGNCRDEIFEPVDIAENLYAPLEQRDDYLKFMDEFTSGMQPIKPDYTAYRHGNMIEVDEGANIDRRNTAMSRMGRLLGKPGLVAEARPMILIQNGQAVAGTFMKKADGVDVSKVGPRDAFRQFTTDNFDNPEAFSDIAAMQALDFICGNVDRHPGNFFLLFDSDPRTNPDAKLTGLQLIDNDLSLQRRSGSSI